MSTESMQRTMSTLLEKDYVMADRARTAREVTKCDRGRVTEGERREGHRWGGRQEQREGGRKERRYRERER